MPELILASCQTLSFLIDRPRRKGSHAVILAHGAGGGMDAELLVALAQRLPARGLAVARFQFEYRQLGRKAPDRQPKLEATYEAVVDALRKKLRGYELVIGGKSMGGRIATHIAPRTDVTAVVLLGYPLHPPGKPDVVRKEHLPAVPVPMLFVQGTRDKLCDLKKLRPVLRGLDTAELFVVEGGDHSLVVPKRSGVPQAEVYDAIADRIAELVAARPRAR